MKLLKWLDRYVEEYLLIILSCFTVIVIFIQVLMRYIFSNSLPWSEEIARYAFIWMIYIGVSYGAKKNKHLSVDVFSELFGQKGKIVIGMLANLCFFVFALVIAYYGADIVMKITRESAAMQLPMGWVYAAPLVGMILTAFRLIQNLWLQFKALRKGSNGEDEYKMKEGGVI